jgi:hypothetical protein
VGIRERVILTDGRRRLELAPHQVDQVYEALWKQGLRLKGGVSAASRIRHAQRMERYSSGRDVSMSEDEFDAVRAVLIS